MIRTIIFGLFLIIISSLRGQSQSKENLEAVIESLSKLSTYKCELNYTIEYPYGGSKSGQSTLTYRKEENDTLCGMNYLIITNPDYRNESSDFVGYFDGCVYMAHKAELNKICIDENPNAFISANGKKAIHKSLIFTQSLPNNIAKLLLECLNDSINFRHYQKSDTLIQNEICSKWEIINKAPEMSYLDKIVTQVAFSKKNVSTDILQGNSI